MGKVTGKSEERRLFLCLFMRYQQQIHYFILSLCPNHSQADDILQETALVMWEKFDELEDQRGFLAWAFKIARFKVLNHRRKKTAGLWLSDEVLDRIYTETEACVRDSSARAQALEKCVTKLDKKEREILSLRYEQNISFPEISNILDRSVNGLYNASARIHQKLRECINRTLRAREA